MANLKDLIVNGISRFINKVYINDSQITTINNSTVGDNPKFTDTTYTAGTGVSLSGTTFSNSGATGVKGNAENSYRTGNVNLTPGNIGAVDKTGDSMTGSLTFNKVTNAIYYQGSMASYPMIKFKDNPDTQYGNGIIIDGGGLTAIGGGESADTVANSIASADSELLCLCNDSHIDIYTNCQGGIDNAVHTTIDGKTFSGRSVCVKDAGNNNDIYFNYSGAGINWADTNWIAAWNGYELRAISKAQIKNGALAWTLIASSTGTTKKTFSSVAGYNEILIEAQFPDLEVSSKMKFFSTIVPASAISSSVLEVWVGGGRGTSTAGYSNTGARAVCNFTSTYIQGVTSNDGPTDRTSQTTWYVRAR